jgi:hypothetical protein
VATRPSRRVATTALTRVRKICLALPDATEKLAWGEPTFRVRDKLFVMFANNHHNDGRIAIWCNAPEGAQQALVEADPVQFFVPPYVGPGGWLGIRLDSDPDWTAVAALIEQAYQTTAQKKRAAAAKKR